MGKEEDTLARQSDEEDSSFNNKEIKDDRTKVEKQDNETEKTKAKESAEKKDNADDIRKVIKLGPTEKEKTEENESIDKKQQEDITLDSPEDATRDAVDQRRAILQSIKSFDFQIKKNQEEITGLNQKLEAIFKDLDDLVSLYEIVSEQMNPFVGLSKVTKRRIDALENFTSEIDTLKERTAELESFAERSGAKLKKIKDQNGESVKTIDTDKILGKAFEGEIVNTVDNNTLEKLSDNELDRIIEKSMGALSLDNRIDMFVDEFIESLKE